MQAVTNDGAVPEPGAPQHSATMRYYVLILLMLVSSVSILDRQIMTILVEPIKAELGASDTKMGLLTGMAFALVYVIMGIPAARLADAWSRRKVIAIAVTLWSAMTMLCGATQSFFQLFLTRFGVGFGEAGGSAPTHAIIGDLFPRERRATAMSVLMLASPIGLGGGLMWGGWALQEYGWRTVFLMAGIPGLILGPLVWFTVPRIRKGGADGIVIQSTGAPPFLATLKILLGTRTLIFMVMAATIGALLSMGVSTWLPAFLERSHHIDRAQIGAGLGAALGTGSLIGHIAGGPLTDLLCRRDLRWHLWIPMIATPLGGIAAVAALLSPVEYTFPLLGLQLLLSGLFSGPMIALIVSLAPVNARATASACTFVIINAFGLGLGPQFVGILSDALRPAFGDDSLQTALLATTSLAIPATLFFYLASRSYRSDLATVMARPQA